mmetsp:Transcript_41955/g.105479  ORF Transcript_41955/g.105479 Transcript_41955/m.105479 type:complete len:201 (-) Transcript_41955:78-680(-)
MAISAVTVPSADSPDKQKHKRSSHRRVNVSWTPAASRVAAKGWFSELAAMGPPGAVTNLGKKRAAVTSAPASGRSAATGRASTRAARGSISANRALHSCAPRSPETCGTTRAPKSGVWTNSPSGKMSPKESYVWQGTDSPIASSTVRNGLVLAAERPLKKLGPVSKWNSPPPLAFGAFARKPCAAPPGASCASHTTTLAP